MSIELHSEINFFGIYYRQRKEVSRRLDRRGAYWKELGFDNKNQYLKWIENHYPVLDLGCGRGYHVSDVNYELGGQYVFGIERFTKPIPKNNPYIISDFGALPFANETFGGIVSVYAYMSYIEPIVRLYKSNLQTVLPHLMSAFEQQTHEVARVLKPNGNLRATVFQYKNGECKMQSLTQDQNRFRIPVYAILAQNNLIITSGESNQICAIKC